MNIDNGLARHHALNIALIAALGAICTFPFAARAQGNNIAAVEAGAASTEPPDYNAYEWSLPRVPVLESLDRDGDGQLDAVEIAAARESLATLDANGDELLDRRELGGPGPIPGWLRLQTPIKVIDKDGDDQIDFSELEQAAAALRRADLDGDWVLSTSELYDRRAVPPSPEGLANVRQFVAMLGHSDVVDPILPGEDPRQYEAYMLYTESGSAGDTTINAGTKLLDPQGNLVHEWASEHGPEGVHSHLLPDGNLLRQAGIGDYLDMRSFPVAAHGVLEIVAPNGEILWEFTHCIENNVCLHHDFAPMPNGNILVTEYNAVPRAELEFHGRTPRPNEREVRWFERILELKPNLEDGSTEIVWMWSDLDHMVQDQFPNRPNYGDIRENHDRFDINFPGNAQRHFHSNGIDYDPERDMIVFSSVNHNEVYIIDHSTTTAEARTGQGGRCGKGGRILFRFGNPAVYGYGDADSQIFGAQHDPHFIKVDDLPGPGDLTVHNNRAGTIPGAEAIGAFGLGMSYSSIVELKLPYDDRGCFQLAENGDPYQTEIVWEYIEEPLGAWHGPFAGAATRVPNGNTVVMNSQTKRVFEVTPEGERVLDFQLPETGRPQKLQKLSLDYPGLVMLLESLEAE